MMGLDGFSMGNLGLNTDLTSAQLVNQTELSVQKESEFKIKNISESEEDQMVKRKEDDEGKSNQQLKENKGNEEEEDEDEDENDAESDEEYDENQQEELTHISENFIENSNPKDFYIRMNSQSGMIELINKKEKRILETIPAKDLMELVSRLNGVSGILVNRKI